MACPAFRLFNVRSPKGNARTGKKIFGTIAKVKIKYSITALSAILSPNRSFVSLKGGDRQRWFCREARYPIFHPKKIL
jgi:hypothetical protein